MFCETFGSPLVLTLLLLSPLPLQCLENTMFAQLHAEWAQVNWFYWKATSLKKCCFSVKSVPYFSSAECFRRLAGCARAEMSREEAYWSQCCSWQHPGWRGWEVVTPPGAGPHLVGSVAPRAGVLPRRKGQCRAGHKQLGKKLVMAALLLQEMWNCRLSRDTFTC